MFITHPLIKPNSIEERLYQSSILNTAVGKNTLCVLPTGTGKTALAVLLSAQRMEKFGGKVLIMAPTRPLAEQHCSAFQNMLTIEKEKIVVLTGVVNPLERKEIYKEAKIIAATPQTIANDLHGGRLSLAEFSLLVVDECHRSVKKYAYPIIVSVYMKQAKNPRVLGLTASPGSTKEKIEEVCKNLGTEAVEMRTEEDEDIKPYIQESKFEVLRAELPEKMLKIQSSLKAALKERVEKLKQCKVNVYSKTDLLLAQKRAASGLRAGNPANFRILSLCAETLKIWHALELLETQSISALCLYLEKLRTQGNKAAERALQDLKVQNALRTAQELKVEGFESPKFILLEKLVKENPKASIIVFSHFRDNISTVFSALKNIEGCKPAVLVGQGGETGQSQKEQIDTIKDFTAGVYNILVTSPVGEEGLHIPSADIAVFYEPVSSEIRTIQRRGRVGRIKAGRVFVLVNKGTRDEANLYTAKRKERRMREELEGIGKGMEQKDK
ncbi:MAG: DEAD/DEAH box helicase [Candidatus Aenigmarchaeota archaeon]|nr:DEAD/DEAH box helicase [Candidatus Aenigmarchaeota archaeon]